MNQLTTIDTIDLAEVESRWKDFALKERSWTEIDFWEEFESFVDYHGKHGSRYWDWFKCFQGWVRTAFRKMKAAAQVVTTKLKDLAAEKLKALRGALMTKTPEYSDTENKWKTIMEDMGVSSATAEKLLARDDVEGLIKNIAYVKKKLAEGDKKIQSVEAYLMAAISNDYAAQEQAAQDSGTNEANFRKETERDYAAEAAAEEAIRMRAMKTFREMFGDAHPKIKEFLSALAANPHGGHGLQEFFAKKTTLSFQEEGSTLNVKCPSRFVVDMIEQTHQVVVREVKKALNINVRIFE